MDKFSFFILNVFLNSFLAFFTVVFLIEGVIFLFRIKQGRVAALLRMIPILKLPLDLSLYDFSRWCYTHGVNPLHCQEGTRILSITFGWINSLTDWLFLPTTSGIQLSLPENVTFTLADMIGYALNPSILKAFSLLFIALSLALLIRRVLLYYRSTVALDSLEKSSEPLCRKMRNSTLCAWIKKYRVEILTSPTLTGSPFVVGFLSSVIYIPNSLSQNLLQKEYEAVLAHEIEHVRYKDNLVRLTLDCITTIFWWIPTKWLCKRIEEGQEVGCDLKCKKYGIDPTDLASAVCKSAKYSINIPHYLFAHHFTKNSILKRVNILLYRPSTRFKNIRFIFTCLATGIAFLVVFLGRFWIF